MYATNHYDLKADNLISSQNKVNFTFSKFKYLMVQKPTYKNIQKLIKTNKNLQKKTIKLNCIQMSCDTFFKGYITLIL